MNVFRAGLSLSIFLLCCWNATSWAGQKKTAQVLVPRDTGSTSEQLLARSLVSAGLVDAGYEIVDSNSSGERQAELGAPADLTVMVMLAVQKGFSTKDQGLYLFSLEASQTALGRVVGASSTRSKPFALANKKRRMEILKQTVIQCRDKTLNQVAQMEQHESKTGQSYALSFMNAPKGSAMRLSGILKKMCQRVKLVSTQGNNPRFTASCKVSLDQLQAGIEEGIRQKLKGSQLRAQKMGNVGLVFAFQE